VVGSALQQRLRRHRGTLQVDCKAISAELLQERAHVQVPEQYDIFEELGQGSAGVVRRARRRADGRDVALKTMRKIDDEFTAIAQKECNILQSISHPHIIKALDFFVSERSVVLVLELFGGSSLDCAVQRAPDRRLAEGTAKGLALKLLEAIGYMHSRHLVHRDVKAANVLVSRDLADLKLVDFNTARQLEDGGSLTMTGTSQYMAPEVLLGEPPSASNDVWGFGLCLHLALSGRLPRVQESYASLAGFASAVATRPVSLRHGHWCDITAAGKDFLRGCLEIDKTSRPASTALLEHEWAHCT